MNFVTRSSPTSAWRLRGLFKRPVRHLGQDRGPRRGQHSADRRQAGRVQASARLVVDQGQGFEHVVNLGQYADQYKNASERLRIRFEPVENLELLTTVEHYLSHGTPSGPILNNPFAGPYTLDGQVFPGATPDSIKHLELNDPTYARGEQTQFIQEVNYTTGAGVLTGVYGYHTTSLVSSLDNDGTILDVSNVLNTAHQNAAYADMRFASREFGGFRFLVGATYPCKRRRSSTSSTSPAASSGLTSHSGSRRVWSRPIRLGFPSDYRSPISA